MKSTFGKHNCIRRRRVLLSEFRGFYKCRLELTPIFIAFFFGDFQAIFYHSFQQIITVSGSSIILQNVIYRPMQIIYFSDVGQG